MNSNNSPKTPTAVRFAKKVEEKRPRFNIRTWHDVRDRGKCALLRENATGVSKTEVKPICPRGFHFCFIVDED
jgi:hypothetical protein